MSEKRLIDANALEQYIKCKIADASISDGISSFIVESTLKEVLFHVEGEPTVLPECRCQKWHPASEIPPLNHMTDEDDDGVLEYEASGPLLLYTANGRTVSGARYVKSDLFTGWDDWSGGLFNTEVTHWMPQPRPPKEQKHG